MEAKTKGIVMEVAQFKGKNFALFTHLAGYYELPDDKLREKAEAAAAAKREISFTHDKQLKILSID
jgi:hypothetical protein